jgi:hypothetical protein
MNGLWAPPWFKGSLFKDNDLQLKILLSLKRIKTTTKKKKKTTLNLTMNLNTHLAVLRLEAEVLRNSLPRLLLMAVFVS